MRPFQLTTASVFDPGRARSVKQQAFGHGMLFNPQIGPPPGRPEIGAGGGHAQAVTGCDVIGADTFLTGAVEIIVARQAGFPSSLDVSLTERMKVIFRSGDMDWAGAAVEGALTPFMGFHPAIDGQDVSPPPAGISRIAPVIEILSLTADIDHRVDRA